MSVSRSTTFTLRQSFPAVENEIDTLQFLSASRGVVWLVEQFGFVFEPVKRDLLQNIEKLNEKYLENTREFNCLLRMILHEYKKGEDRAIEALLWLRRGLTYMNKFLLLFIENEKKGIHNENLYDIMSVAYEQTLATHHGFFIRCLFGTLQSQCPSRSRFLTIIGHQGMQNKEVIISLLSNYSEKLTTNLETLTSFHRKHNIQPHH